MTRLEKINQLTAQVHRLRRLLQITGHRRGLSAIERSQIERAIDLKVVDYERTYQNKH